MNFKASVIAVLLAAAFSRRQPVWAQSLAELARKEQERRKTDAGHEGLHEQGPSGRSGVRGRGSRRSGTRRFVSTTGNAGDAAAQTPPAAGDTGAAAQPAADASKEPAKDRDYWAGRMKDLQTDPRPRSDVRAGAAGPVNALTTDFVNRDDPAQRAVIANDRQKAIAELDRLQKAIDDDKKAIADVRGRSAPRGVPPGWLR